MWIAVTVAFFMTLLAGADADAHRPRALAQEHTYLRTSPKGLAVTKFTARTDVIEMLYGPQANETFIDDRGRFRRIVSGD